MKKLATGIIACGLAASMALSASAAADQFIFDAHRQLIYNIEVGTTVGEVTDIMFERGYPIWDIEGNGLLVSDNQVVHTGFTGSVTKIGVTYLSVAGDVDKDGDVDTDDVTQVSKCLAYKNTGGDAHDFFEEDCVYQAADANMDGNIDISDVMAISRIIAQHS